MSGESAQGDAVLRRAMFVLELVDPVTGVPVGFEMEANAEGLRAPSVTRAGQLVWLDVDPAADRSIKVSATARRRQYAPFAAVLAIAKRTPGVAPPRIRRELQPTGLYQPPSGRLATAGMVIADAQTRAPIVGAQVVLALAAGDLGTTMHSNLVAISDERGGFVAVAAGLGNDKPKPAPRPAPDGSVVGWLEISWQGVMRKTAEIALRQSQLNYLPEPLIWAELTP